MQGTIKCPICGRPYKWYSMTVADQSACPTCVEIAERRASSPTQDEEREYSRRRSNYWNR